MTTYYRDAFVQVTSDAVQVDGRRYPLAELTRVWHRRGARSWRTLAGRGALGLALLVPLVTAGIGLVVALLIDASLGGRILLVLGACLVGLLAGPLADVLLERVDRSYARGAHTVEIWATWRGAPVLLLRTEDALRFGQIYRALQRASERAPAPRR
ncbi:MAG TPA: DUF6232 family protein [Micromonosporaceae bacterium]|jgi:Family of unknown function (DUF6232)